MEQYTYEIIEEGAVPETKEYKPSDYTMFTKYLEENRMTFEWFKRYFPYDTKVLRVKFNNIPTRTPSETKIQNWKNVNNDYKDKLTSIKIIMFSIINKRPNPDIFNTFLTDDNGEVIISERQLRDTLASNITMVQGKDGGNRKSRRNRKRKKSKKNRSSRINARISRNLII
jgi:hypothetical protein